MDTLDRPIADFVKGWSRSLRDEMTSVDTGRVRDVLRLHPLDVVCAPRGSKRLLHAFLSECHDHDDIPGDLLDEFEARRGLSRPPGESAPYATPWGCVYVPGYEALLPEDESHVSAAGIALLNARIARWMGGLGFELSRGAADVPAEVAAAWAAGPPAATPLAALDEEDAFILVSLGLAVSTRRLELASLPHPLALALSTDVDVVAVRCERGGPVELDVARQGQSIGLDLGAVPRWRDDITDAMLRDALPTPRRFCALAGIEVRGFSATVRHLRAFLQDRTGGASDEVLGGVVLDDHQGAENVLRFRRRGR